MPPLPRRPRTAFELQAEARRQLAASAKLGGQGSALDALKALQGARGQLQAEAGLLSQTSSIIRPALSKRESAGRLGPVIGPRQPRPAARWPRGPQLAPVGRRPISPRQPLNGVPGKAARQRVREMRRRLLGGF